MDAGRSSIEDEIRTLFGLCVVPESNLEPVHSLGTVLLYGDPRVVSLSQFRQLICSNEYGISSADLPMEFHFVTEKGFPISQNIESLVVVSDLGTKSGQVLIRVTRSRHKIGVRIRENPLDRNGSSLGFVYCDTSATLEEFRKEMKKQLPHLSEGLHSTGVVLDHNYWPVSKEQESMLCVFEAVVSNEIHIRIHTHSHSAGFPNTQSNWKPSDVPLDPHIHTTSTCPPSHWDGGGDQVKPGCTSRDSIVLDPVDAGLLSSALPAKHQCDIFISYVRVEAFPFASELKSHLRKRGFSVFLDADEISFGVDWQDVLNNAIDSCRLFLALVTPRYGETIWTNREVKLADILSKTIVPVNFTSFWPPQCLAIQFATTQFIPWKSNDDLDSSPMEWVAGEISVKYGAEIRSQTPESLEVFGVHVSSGSEDTDGDNSAMITLKVPKKPSLRSCPSTLPKSVAPELVEFLRQPRSGPNLVVLINDAHQLLLQRETSAFLRRLGYDVYVTREATENNTCEFANKVDEAGVVVVIVSEELLASESCKQQIFYCEHRTVIVPVIVGKIQLPHWLSTLIGTAEFVQAQASTYEGVLKESVAKALMTVSPEEKVEEDKMRTERFNSLKKEVLRALPTEGKHVYISGGTKFFSDIGEAVCKEIGRQLAHYQDITLITGGFYGVGDTIARSFHEERLKLDFLPNVFHIQAKKDSQDKSAQTRQNKDGSFLKVPYGETVFVGDSVRERETLIGIVLQTCVLVEGGPGAAYEAEQFAWNGGIVIPVKVTGGAAGGGFNIPQSILTCPPSVHKDDWDLLGDSKASASDIAAAVVRIVLNVTSDSFTVFRPSISSVSESDLGTVTEGQGLDRKRPWSLAHGETDILP